MIRTAELAQLTLKSFWLEDHSGRTAEGKQRERERNRAWEKLGRRKPRNRKAKVFEVVDYSLD